MGDSKIKIEYVPISKVNPAEYNPRQMSEDEFRKLKKNLEEFGCVDPLIINKDFTLIGGHQRLKALKDIGYEEVPAIILEVDKKKEKALNLALNKIRGEWDYGKLSGLLKEIEGFGDFDIELTGFDELEAVELTELTEFDGASFGDDLTDPGAGSYTTPGKTIQYVLIFNDEDEQTAWHQYLKALKDEYPDLGTISERLIKDIESRGAK